MRKNPKRIITFSYISNSVPTYYYFL